MKTYVITGAGSGIGRAAASVLTRDNPEVRIVLIGRNRKLLEETRETLNDPTRHVIGNFDIRDSGAWKKLYASEVLKNANICGLFANAGVGGENHYGINDRWDEVISINLTGTYTSVFETLPMLGLSSEQYRHIVITSSCLGRFGVSGYTAYCTAKTGLLGLTRALAIEFAPRKILVNAICPGWVRTDMAQAGIAKLADSKNISYEDSFDEQMSYVPMGKISEPGEIGELVQFLFSGKQVSMTGQGIDINNGSFMI